MLVVEFHVDWNSRYNNYKWCNFSRAEQLTRKLKLPTHRYFTCKSCGGCGFLALNREYYNREHFFWGPLKPFLENFPLYGICPPFILLYLESLSVLSQATRNALHGDDPLDQLAEDFAALDIENILTQTLFAVQPLSLSDRCALMVPECECVCVCGVCAHQGVCGWVCGVWSERIIQHWVLESVSVQFYDDYVYVVTLYICYCTDDKLVSLIEIIVLVK